MTDLSTLAELASVDDGLCVFSTLRGDGSAQASVVNAGVLQHPLTGVQVVGLVATGAARKLRNLRADPRATIVARACRQWAAAEGSAQLIGLDDPHPDVNDEQLRLLLRAVFTAAGGTHDDWDTDDYARGTSNRRLRPTHPRLLESGMNAVTHQGRPPN